MDLLLAFVAGLAAGIGVAAPLGPIGVLLINEGIARGFRAGAPSAIAVAVVDLSYCTAALAIGALAQPVIAGWGAWPQAIGGAVLILLAAVGLHRTGRQGAAALATPAGPGAGRFVLFLGLTALNPATLIYFAALAVGLTVLNSPLAAVAFVVGVGLASGGWQLALVALGASLRGRTTPRTQRLTALVGNLIVATLGAIMLIGAGLSLR
ncbi:MAG: hypothetical protein WAU30_06425 [Propionicimonas sp.]